MSYLSTPNDPHSALIQIGAELAGVAVIAVIAGSGPKAGKAMLGLVILLWLIALMVHTSK